MNKNDLIWNGPDGIKFPPSVKDPDEIVSLAHHLTPNQQHQIVSAFKAEAYEMAAEYIWKKAMVLLKEKLCSLGMKFIGEMIGKADFDEYTSVYSEITDFRAIQLAEQLGVISTTAAIKMRHNNELITHLFSKDATEQLDHLTALNIVKSSIQYILGDSDTTTAIEFSKFRERILSEALKENDPQLEHIAGLPIFYLRTVLTVILSAIRNDLGAKLENALANLNLFLPKMWPNIADSDKWNVGTVYRDVIAAGNSTAAAGLKNALLKVNGFDFVPENLRSQTFINTAQQVIETHFAFDNFFNEPPIVSKLSSLGSTIPAPALAQCMQAYLAVFLGNRYGVSKGAAPIAHKELTRISRERWRFYFEKLIQFDEIILAKCAGNRLERFSGLLSEINMTDFTGMPRLNQTLYNAIVKNNNEKAEELAGRIILSLRQKRE